MSVNLDLQGREYDEAIPEIRCRADMAGAEIFEIHSHELEFTFRVLAFQEWQAEELVWKLESEEPDPFYDDYVDLDADSATPTEEIDSSPKDDQDRQNHPQDLGNVRDGEQKIQSQQNENEQHD